MASRATPGAWLMTVAKRRAVDLFRRNRELRSKYAQIGRALEAEGDAVTPRLRPRLLRRDRRRPAPAGVHRLPPGAGRPGPGRADPAAARRPDHGRDRPRLPGAGGHRRPAHRAGQEGAGQRRGAVRGAGPGRAARPAVVRPRGHLPHLQRGLLGHRRGRLDAPRPLPGGAAAGPAAGRDRPRRARGARPAGADGDPGLPAPGPRRARRGAGTAARSGPGALGPAADQPRPGRPGPGRAARRLGRPLRPASGHRRLPRAGVPVRGDRLDPDRRAVRRAGPAGRRPRSSS